MSKIKLEELGELNEKFKQELNQARIKCKKLNDWRHTFFFLPLLLAAAILIVGITFPLATNSYVSLNIFLVIFATFLPMYDRLGRMERGYSKKM